MLARYVLLAVVAALATLVGCRGCVEDKGPARLLDIPHPQAPLIVEVPDLEALLLGVDAFAHRATQKAAAGLLERFQQGLEQQLGLNPFVPGAATKVGIDAKQGVLAFLEPGHDVPVFALSVTDRKTADGALKALMAKLDGANKEEAWKIGERDAMTLGRPFGDRVVPVLHWTYVGRVAIVAPAAAKAALTAVVERVAQALRPQGAPLPPSPLERLRSKVPAGLVFSYTRGFAQQAFVPKTETLTRFHASAAGFEMDTFVGLAVPGLKEALAGPAPIELARSVEPGACALLLTGAARPAGLQALRNLPELSAFVDAQGASIARLVGVDIANDALPLFAGPLTAAVHLEDVASIPARIEKRRFSSLMDVVQVSIVADLKDPNAMLALLTKAQASLAEQGVKLRTRQVKHDAKKISVFEPDTDKPKLGWTVVGNRYVYAAGPGRLDKVLAYMRAQSDGMAPAVQQGVGGALAQETGASIVVLRGDSVAEAMSALHLKRGYGVGELLDAASALLRTLGDVALSITAEPDGLRIKVREALK